MQIAGAVSDAEIANEVVVYDLNTGRNRVKYHSHYYLL